MQRVLREKEGLAARYLATKKELEELQHAYSMQESRTQLLLEEERAAKAAESARLQRELAVAQTLNSKLVERENLAAERIAREAVTAIKKPFVPEGGFNPELEPTSAESVAASEALLAAAGDPAAAAVAAAPPPPPPPPLSS